MTASNDVPQDSRFSDHDQTPAIFEILAHQRRRYALYELQHHERPLALADLADEVAVRENETALAAVPAVEVKRIYMTLYHTHIPKLADADLVRYNQERDMVTLTNSANHREQYQSTPELLDVGK
jgi:hypothetical protein